MISEMKKIYVLTRSEHRKSALELLRSAGVVHISGKPVSISADTNGEKKRLSDISAVCSKLLDARSSMPRQKVQSDEFVISGESAQALSRLGVAIDFKTADADDIVRESIRLMSECASLKTESARIRDSLSAMAFWGDFDVRLLDDIRRKGIGIVFAEVERSVERSVLEDFDCIRMWRTGGSSSVFAIILKDGKALPSGLKVLADVTEGVSDLEADLDKANCRISDIDSYFAVLSMFSDRIIARKKEVERNLELLSVSDSFSGSGNIVYVPGFIPASSVSGFEKAMSGHGELGYCICDVDEDDEPPTLLENGAYSSMLKPVIDILGLFPGYRERDISFWFLSFFAIFFSLIIGDAAYGMVFLLSGVALAVRKRKLTNISGLLVLLGGCTVAWGVMTGTYFGSELILRSSPFLRRLVVPALTNFPSVFGLSAIYAQNSIMRLCFTIGALQLILACVMNVAHKSRRRDLSLFADVGWYLIIQSLYFVVLYLLIKGRLESDVLENHSNVVIGLIASGFLMIVVFGGQAPGKTFAQGLKSGLADIFTTFLNVVSAFGNIMSYIRLFAVGMASVAIAGSFNQIAQNFYSGVMFAVAAVILTIGHVLNLVMGLLSVVVHGVRLNVMEFSNQLGLEWAGYEYHPFK